MKGNQVWRICWDLLPSTIWLKNASTHCSVMRWSVNQIHSTFIVLFKCSAKRDQIYWGISRRELGYQKAWRPEFVRANYICRGKAPVSTKQSEANSYWCTCSYAWSQTYWSHVHRSYAQVRKEEQGFSRGKIAVSAEIKKSRDWLRPWSLGRHSQFFGFKRGCSVL